MYCKNINDLIRFESTKNLCTAGGLMKFINSSIFMSRTSVTDATAVRNNSKQIRLDRQSREAIAMLEKMRPGTALKDSNIRLGTALKRT